MKAYHLDSIFTFGKYKGKTLREVIEIDEYYVSWCASNLDHFYITETTLEEIEHAYPSFSMWDYALNKLAEKKASYKGHSSYDRKADFDEYYDSSTSEYGGYNGFDDLAIEVAFEGDPENTWNVD